MLVESQKARANPPHTHELGLNDRWGRVRTILWGNMKRWGYVNAGVT